MPTELSEFDIRTRFLVNWFFVEPGAPNEIEYLALPEAIQGFGADPQSLEIFAIIMNFYHGTTPKKSFFD